MPCGNGQEKGKALAYLHFLWFVVDIEHANNRDRKVCGIVKSPDAIDNGPQLVSDISESPFER